MVKTSPENPSEKGACTVTQWTNEECETVTLKEKTCHKDLEVSVVI